MSRVGQGVVPARILVLPLGKENGRIQYRRQHGSQNQSGRDKKNLTGYLRGGSAENCRHSQPARGYLGRGRNRLERNQLNGSGGIVASYRSRAVPLSAGEAPVHRRNLASNSPNRLRLLRSGRRSLLPVPSAILFVRDGK
uniref:(northern house mosquito) hypothetical protein n=1 Tax=Culex pipiens TaxID=7175 RepID=A0A8D8HL70_CULPI